MPGKVNRWVTAIARRWLKQVVSTVVREGGKFLLLLVVVVVVAAVVAVVEDGSMVRVPDEKQW